MERTGTCKLKKILDSLEKVIKVVCAVLLIGIMILVAAQVFTRYVMGHALTWSEHAARALFIWMIMLYAGVLVRNAGNLGFDLIAKVLPKWLNNTFNFICEAGILAFSAYWFVNGVKLCQSFGDIKFADLKLPYNTIYAAEPVGAAIICIFSVEVIARRILDLRNERRGTEC